MTSVLMLNGQPRKQLSEQLDRLDGIIDVLADGLNEAVVDAVKTGAAVAVREVLLEMISQPDRIEFLQPFLQEICRQHKKEKTNRLMNWTRKACAAIKKFSMRFRNKFAVCISGPTC